MHDIDHVPDLMKGGPREGVYEYPLEVRRAPVERCLEDGEAGEGDEADIEGSPSIE